MVEAAVGSHVVTTVSSKDAMESPAGPVAVTDTCRVTAPTMPTMAARSSHLGVGVDVDGVVMHVAPGLRCTGSGPMRNCHHRRCLQWEDLLSNHRAHHRPRETERAPPRCSRRRARFSVASPLAIPTGGSHSEARTR